MSTSTVWRHVQAATSLHIMLLDHCKPIHLLAAVLAPQAVPLCKQESCATIRIAGQQRQECKQVYVSPVDRVTRLMIGTCPVPHRQISIKEQDQTTARSFVSHLLRNLVVVDKAPRSNCHNDNDGNDDEQDNEPAAHPLPSGLLVRLGFHQLVHTRFHMIPGFTHLQFMSLKFAFSP